MIAWSSKRQSTPAHSSTEAEYVALGSATREAIWLRLLRDEKGCVQQHPTPLFEDNQGAISLVKNPVLHQRTKHIDIQYHIVRSASERNIIRVEWVQSKNMIADILTKGLPRELHDNCVKGLGLEIGRT